MTTGSTIHSGQNDREHGSTTIELAVLTPLVLLVLGLMVAGGRIVTAHAHVDEAAATAARAATLARSPAAGQTAATEAGQQILSQKRVPCQPPRIQIDTRRFTAPFGQAGQVRVTTACTVSLADLLVPGLPGTVRIAKTFASPTDPFRGTP